MKAVLISIQPKWCEKIASGEKTIEVRKTKPKLETPFKVYIYCTKPSKKYQTICGCMVINTDELYRLPSGKIKHDWSGELMCCNGEYTRDNFLNGKVIGEFVCDEITQFGNNFFLPSMLWIEKEACLSGVEICEYLGEKESGFGWHISQLKIYNKPKELKEFTPICRVRKDLCEICCFHEEEFGGCFRSLTRPPQSWCYVED